MLTINLEPVYAIVLALFIFCDKEKMNVEFYFGAFIILFVVSTYQENDIRSNFIENNITAISTITFTEV